MATTVPETIEGIAIETIEEDVCTGAPQPGGCIYCSGPETD